MDNLAPPTHPHPAPAETAASFNLTTFPHSLVPPYFLKCGPNLGVSYALLSFTGFLCHVIFMGFVIAWAIGKGLDWLIGTVTLPAKLSAIATSISLGLDRLADSTHLPAWFVLSFFGWWLGSSVWMAVAYRRHHDGTLGWRVYIFGGRWAWRFWKRGNSDGDFDFD